MPNPSSPYYIQSGPACIACSFGRTSAKMLHDILEAHDGQLPPDVFVSFQNTGEEVEKTYIFGRELSRRWNIPIHWLEFDDEFDIDDYLNRHGELSRNRQPRDLEEIDDWGFRVVDFDTACRKGEPFDKFLKYYADYRHWIKGLGPILPTRVTRQCTATMKIKIQTRWMNMMGYEYFDAYTGIRADEPRRWTKIYDQNDRSERFTYILPMVTAGETKAGVLDFWSHQPFDLGLDPDAEEGNCRLCFLKATGKIVRIMRRLIEANGGQPDEEIMRWVNREVETGLTFRIDRPPLVQLLSQAQSEAVIPAYADDGAPSIDCICGDAAV
jgi:hypothetical protein